MKELLNKHNQRSCPMKKSIQTVPYNTHSNPWNSKKFLAGIMLVAVPVFVSCEKDNEKPNNNGGNNPTQQRTEEFIYNQNMKFYRPGNSEKIPHAAFADTVAKYAADGNVKQIHIAPETEGMFATANQNQMDQRAEYLSNTYNISNTKLSGENTTLILSPEAIQSQLVQEALHNKLKIALVQRSK